MKMSIPQIIWRPLSSASLCSVFLAVIVFTRSGTHVDSTLTTETVAEPGCLEMEAAQDVEFSFLVKLVSGGIFHVPMGSISSYYLWAELLKGSPMQSEEEMSTMCPTVTVQMTTATLTAYKNTLVQKCGIVSLGVVNCTLDVAVNQPTVYSKANAISTFVWTDNEKNVLLVGCVDGKYKSWALYSTDKSVDEKTKGQILEIVTKKGFDVTRNFVYSYEKC